jgi:hypothetical protein
MACVLVACGSAAPEDHPLHPYQLHPWHAPFAGMALCLVLHAPALRAPRLDAEKTLRLAEHATYYALLHGALLAAMELGGAAPATLWTTLAYACLFYAWHIHAAAHRMPNCTLSPLCLSGAAFAFCSGCVGACTRVRPPEDPFATHLAAWALADACAFVFAVCFRM